MYIIPKVEKEDFKILSQFRVKLISKKPYRFFFIKKKKIR